MVSMASQVEPLLAAHGPIDRWSDPGFVVGAMVAFCLGGLAVALLGSKIGWSVLHRFELGAGAVLMTLPAATLWSTTPGTATVTLVAAGSGIAPLLIAVARRSRHLDHRARIAWWVSVAVGSALAIWSEFGTDAWDNGNDWRPAYIVDVAVAWSLVAALWTLSWFVGWGAAGTRGLLRLWGGDSIEAGLIEPAPDHHETRNDHGGHVRVQPRAPAPVAHTAETLVHSRRIRVLALLAFGAGVAMIPTVVLAVPGIGVMIVSMSVLRAAQTPARRAGPWPHWAPAVLTGALAAAVVTTIAVVRWVIADDVESVWTALLALALIVWTSAFAFAVVAARTEVLGDR